MSGDLEMFRIEEPVYPSLGSHYEKELKAKLATIWRQKLLVLTAVTAGLVLGILAIFVVPKSYMAEAYIHGGVAAPPGISADQVSNTGPSISWDPAQLVETRSRLLRSHQLARQVVERLGLERLRPELGGLSWWLQDIFYGRATRTPAYQEDFAAKKLQQRLDVKTEPRVYLITVSYDAGTPELAALITNSFATEFLRMITLQVLSDQRALAQTALSEKVATFGEKHPITKGARRRVAAADALLEAELSKAPEEIMRSAGKDVDFAQAVIVPASPKPKVFIGIALLGGLVAGIWLALWVDRNPVDRNPTSTRTRPENADWAAQASQAAGQAPQTSAHAQEVSAADPSLPALLT
jgi:uncharacterized protein involved in exopolysaccharide biosynthesis